jgi:hypothetical protein
MSLFAEHLGIPLTINSSVVIPVDITTDNQSKPASTGKVDRFVGGLVHGGEPLLAVNQQGDQRIRVLVVYGIRFPRRVDTEGIIIHIPRWTANRMPHEEIGVRFTEVATREDLPYRRPSMLPGSDDSRYCVEARGALRSPGYSS